MAKSALKSTPPTAATSAPAPVNGDDKPVHTIRYGAARGLIWTSESNGRASFTLSVDRCVTDKTGADHVSQNFQAADMRHLARVVVESCRWIEWQQRRQSEVAPSVR